MEVKFVRRRAPPAFAAPHVFPFPDDRKARHGEVPSDLMPPTRHGDALNQGEIALLRLNPEQSKSVTPFNSGCAESVLTR